MRAVIYHPKVPAEARAFLAHYDAISTELGDSFWEELTEAIEYARTHPARHHFDRSGRRRSNLKRFPIHILFRILPSAIRVTAIRHDRQDPSYGGRRQ
jgi:plasmid stabilization system protein ParE